VTGFHWTGLEVGVLAVAVSVLAGLAWMQFEKRRDDRGRAACVCLDPEFAALLSEVEPELKSALRDENAVLLDDLAVLHPMPQRPAPPAAAPGEPWQLPASVTDPARLVERSEIHDR
jgi:hypothetical protein